MSKSGQENQGVAQSSVESPSGVISTNENSVNKILELLKLNVKDHTEKKNGLSYLSWAWAWTEALKADSNASFEVTLFNGAPFMDINGTGMVWVTVTMFGKPMTCFLPIMDHRNKPIQKPDAFQVNTSLMRCMTKALALHGIGLYIYAGEDLPEQEEAPAKLEVKAVKTAEAKARDDQDDANIALFGQSMIDFVGICKSIPDLMSYWKANQEQIERLQANNAALYEKVVHVFKTARAELPKGEVV